MFNGEARGQDKSDFFQAPPGLDVMLGGVNSALFRASLCHPREAQPSSPASAFFSFFGLLGAATAVC